MRAVRHISYLKNFTGNPSGIVNLRNFVDVDA
jgi:hypothetical protein